VALTARSHGAFWAARWAFFWPCLFAPHLFTHAWLTIASLVQLFAEHYRSVLETPDGMDHMNIRNFMKNGWEGVNFENGISLTKKVKGESDWGFEEESWIP